MNKQNDNQYFPKLNILKHSLLLERFFFVWGIFLKSISNEIRLSFE